MPPKGTTLAAGNRRARHDYEILDTFEAGIVLRGSEVKSLREGKAQLTEAYARADDGELWLHGCHIPPYSHAGPSTNHDPDRARKLLMHRVEIDRLADRVARDRLSLVPLSIYFREGTAKVELALGRGRKKADKRRAIAERDAKREAEREMGRRQKGHR